VTLPDVTGGEGDPLHLVVAGSLDQRTGGYLYDARMVAGLRALGRRVEVHEVEGRWPAADREGRRDLAAHLDALPDGAVVVLDGLVGGAVPDLIEPHAQRLRVIALVHHPLCDELRGPGGATPDAARLEALEARTLAAGRGVIVTSAFTRDRVVEMGVDAADVRVVEPGTEAPAPGEEPPRSPTGAPTLLCVASVVPRKGQLDLVHALARLTELAWRCEVVGSLERDAGYAADVRDAIEARGLEDRVALRGEVSEADLAEAWAGADLFVLPSRYEGYGMAFTEALVHGLPIVGTTGGAIPSTVPPEVGTLVPPGDVDALADALRGILENPDIRTRMAERSRRHAASLPGWTRQVAAFDRAVAELADSRDRGDTFSSDWLTLREPADHRARSDRLAVRLSEVGSARRWSTILDLGSGRGSNLRWLAPRLGWARRWVALDHDAGLLAEIEAAWAVEGVDSPGDLRTVRGDLSDEGLAEVAGADLVTASALLDLVTEAWVRDLAAACAARGAGALLALSWDGTATLRPSDPMAEEVLDAVRTHQQGEKGMGVALGPRAPGVTAAAFREVGMEVTTAATPWRLEGRDDGPLIAALVEGWVGAAYEVVPERAEAFRAWLREVKPALLHGAVAASVGHVDLLALPRDAATRGGSS